MFFMSTNILISRENSKNSHPTPPRTKKIAFPSKILAEKFHIADHRGEAEYEKAWKEKVLFYYDKKQEQLLAWEKEQTESASTVDDP